MLKSAQNHTTNSGHDVGQKISRTYSSFVTESLQPVINSVHLLSSFPSTAIRVWFDLVFASLNLAAFALRGIRRHFLYLKIVSWGYISDQPTSPPKQGDPTKKTNKRNKKCAYYLNSGDGVTGEDIYANSSTFIYHIVAGFHGIDYTSVKLWGGEKRIVRYQRISPERLIGPERLIKWKDENRPWKHKLEEKTKTKTKVDLQPPSCLRLHSWPWSLEPLFRRIIFYQGADANYVTFPKEQGTQRVDFDRQVHTF